MKKSTNKLIVVILFVWASILFSEETIMAQSLGIWSSESELSTIPMSGSSWQEALNGANQNTSIPNISDMNDNTDCYVLAAAIVSARYKAAGDTTNANYYKNKVIQAINYIVTVGNPGGLTLAAGRNVGAYVMASDLVGYRTTAFENWIYNMIDVWDLGGRTMLSTFLDRPNNWGTMNFGSLAAMYWYLGDTAKMTYIRNYFVAAITPGVPNPGHNYDIDLSWQADPNIPKIINGCNTSKQGMNLDGLLPEEMRRGASFQIPPVHTNYPWGTMNGIIAGARVMERYGTPIWDVANKAIYRAAYALQIRLENDYGGWAASGDDLWQLVFIDKAYGSNFACGQPSGIWQHGKNVGWAYILGGDASINCNPYTLDPCSTATSTENINKEEFAIGFYPNPANNFIQLSIITDKSFKGTVSLSNLLGKEIMIKPIDFMNNATVSIDISQLENGIYMMMVVPENGGIIQTKKIIKY